MDSMICQRPLLGGEACLFRCSQHLDAKKESVETAMQYNYNYGDGGVVDETSAEFKQMGEDRKAAKKESVGKYPAVHLFR